MKVQSPEWNSHLISKASETPGPFHCLTVTSLLSRRGSSHNHAGSLPHISASRTVRDAFLLFISPWYFVITAKKIRTGECCFIF